MVSVLEEKLEQWGKELHMQLISVMYKVHGNIFPVLSLINVTLIFELCNNVIREA